MSSITETAHRYSRRRAMLFAIAALLFLAIHAVGRPFQYSNARTGVDWWALNAVVLLAAIATGGGLLNRREVRKLVNDEVARENHRRSVVAGFWTTMAIGMVLYVLPAFRERSARDTLFLMVTAGIAVSMLVFATLELRAHKDA